MRFTSFNKTVGWGAISSQSGSNNITFATTPATIAEATSGSYIVNTVGLVNGTTLYWTINNITTNDAQFSAVSGSFTITSNSGTFSVSPVSNWMTTPSTTFTVSIRTDSVSGPIAITSSTTSVLHNATSGAYLSGQNSGYYLNASYRLGLNNTTANIFTYTSLAGGWNDISVGPASLTGVKNDNTLWVSGENRSGVMALTTNKNWNWLSAADHVLGVDDSGRLWAWGGNQRGQLGLGDTLNRSSPVQVGTATDWQKVFAGGSIAYGESFAIKTDGSLYSWGYNNNGQLGSGTTLNRSSPAQIGAGSTWVYMAMGTGSNAFALGMKSDLTLWAWGRNLYGQLGQNDTINRSSPVQIAGSWAVVSSCTNAGHAMGLKTDGKLYVWGNGGSGQIGNSSTTSRSSPVQFGTDTWTAIGCGPNHSTAIKSTGGWYGCGAGTSGELGNGGVSRSSFILVGTDSGYLDTACGYVNSFRLALNGTLQCTGYNVAGQLGIGSTGTASTFNTVTTNSGQWTAIYPGIQQTLGFTNGSGREAYLWGDGSHGEYGGFNSFYRSAPVQITSAVDEIYNSPVQVGTDTNWKYTANGALHVLAVKTDGTMWAWGLNSSGQLGNGTTLNTSSPIQIGSDTNWASVTAAGDFSFAIKDDFTLWSWGINSQGQLGINTTSRRSTPQQIAGSWIAVDSYSLDTIGHVIGLKTDYTLWSWGYGLTGQLGTNNAISRSNPAQIGADTWKQFSVGNQYTVGIKSNGSLWAWGLNGSGQLGIGNTLYRSSPTQVGTSSWNFVAANDGATIGVVVGNSNLFSWGRDLYGMLGAGASVQRSSPVQVSTGINASTVKSLKKGIPRATIIQI